MVEHKQQLDRFMYQYMTVSALALFIFWCIVRMCLQRQQRLAEECFQRLKRLAEARAEENTGFQRLKRLAEARAEENTGFTAGSGFYHCDYRKQKPMAGKTGRPFTPARCAAAAEQRAAEQAAEQAAE
jgi:hypothetical protein